MMNYKPSDWQEQVNILRQDLQYPIQTDDPNKVDNSCLSGDCKYRMQSGFVPDPCIPKMQIPPPMRELPKESYLAPLYAPPKRCPEPHDIPPHAEGNYWQCRPHFNPAHGNPPINHHVKHTQKYFYTTLFLEDYYGHKPYLPCPPPPGPLPVYADILSVFPPNSKLQWNPADLNILIIKHNLRYPITLEIWDNHGRPLTYAPVLKPTVTPITIGECIVIDRNTIEVDFRKLYKPKFNEKFLLGMKEIPDLILDPYVPPCPPPPPHPPFVGGSPALPPQDDQWRTKDVLREFGCLPPPPPTLGLAIVFRRNSLEGLFQLIAEFDETYFHSMEQSADVQYLLEKSSYKDLYFNTIYTNNLQDVLDKIDVTRYQVEYSWENHKRYRDQYNDYEAKYGYR